MKRLQQEYERRKKQLHDLCSAVKSDSISDLQDILCCIVLSECVYKVLFSLFFYVMVMGFVLCLQFRSIKLSSLLT